MTTGRDTFKSAERQRRIGRPEDGVTQPRQAFPAYSSGSGGGALQARVIEVNRTIGQVEAYLVKRAFDPTDPLEWANDENFDTDNPVCFWPMQSPVTWCAIGWPAIIFPGPAGNWGHCEPKIHRDAIDPHQWGEPYGNRAPDLSINQEPGLEDPGICDTLYACCLPDSTCADLNVRDCLAAGGIYYGPGTEDGGETGKVCADGVPCAPLYACIDPDNPTVCVDLATQAECAALGWQYFPGHTCDSLGL